MNPHPPFPHQKETPLCEFSTFGIGGPARYFAEAHTCEQMQQMLSYAHNAALRTLIIGKGSNCLFDDRGFNGLAILNRIDYLQEHENGLFRVGAGYSFARLGGITARQGWSGLEFASGIPATVGGAIYMNAGANGQDTSATLAEVGYVTASGELQRLKREELSFDYRFSSFQKREGAIVEGLFQLKPSIGAKQTQKELLGYRLKTQPYGEKSAGCAFRNTDSGPAGKLIEECGLKGVRVGGAAVSGMHANFIVNTRGATTQDVLDLMRCIKERVYAEKGVILEEEIRHISYE
ncbi:UDP-N-acetylmuramate dehydrogenase [Chlamydiota bacterium]